MDDAESGEGDIPRKWLVIWSLLAQAVPQSFHLQVKQRLLVLFLPI